LNEFLELAHASAYAFFGSKSPRQQQT